jgi:hypothetical protein
MARDPFLSAPRLSEPIARFLWRRRLAAIRDKVDLAVTWYEIKRLANMALRQNFFFFQRHSRVPSKCLDNESIYSYFCFKSICF